MGLTPQAGQLPLSQLSSPRQWLFSEAGLGPSVSVTYVGKIVSGKQDIVNFSGSAHLIDPECLLCATYFHKGYFSSLSRNLQACINIPILQTTKKWQDEEADREMKGLAEGPGDTKSWTPHLNPGLWTPTPGLLQWCYAIWALKELTLQQKRWTRQMCGPVRPVLKTAKDQLEGSEF